MTDNTGQSEDFPEQDSQSLVISSQRGDLSAFNKLVQRYFGRIYGLAYNMTSNRFDAEDIVQEVFVKAYRNLRHFRGRSSFYTWIYRIALNTTINYRKNRSRQQSIDLDEIDPDIQKDPAFQTISSSASPTKNIKIKELQKELNEALQKLSDKHRKAVVMHDIQGMSHKEIAKIEKCSSGTIRSRLFYARKKLQAKLSGLV